MSKRPAENFEASPANVPDDGSRARKRRRRIEAALDHSQKEFFRALKLSRGLERQKLGRRQKKARADGNDEAIARMEKEVTALKHLDLSSIAELHICKSLLKVPHVHDSPLLPSFVISKVKDAPHVVDRIVENVKARLLNSNPAKTALQQVLSTACATLQVPIEVANKRKRLRAGTFASKSEHLDSNRDRSDSPSLSSQASWSGISTNPSATASCEIASEDEIALDSGSEALQSRQRLRSLLLNDIAKNLEGESIRSDIVSDLPSSLISSRDSTDRSVEEDLPIPALNYGYVSGSSDAESVSSTDVRPRKNRRGQQERRAIWEKKFGKNANHVKRQETSRDHGWDAKRGALSSSGNMKDQPHGRLPRSSQAQTHFSKTNRGSREKPIKGSKGGKTVSEAPLHPSWEAARKAKEKPGIKLLPFQGKKLVFD